ncbi:glycosyltransferase [Mycolicibacterium celeriflavum]|uniref:glycosyltransferase n=1 Tax=Mycolicibacterium celeriflavum TaxID=1249101 RepID=UPI003CE806E0
MAVVLAYTSPALGHMLPISALCVELSRRGHTVHLRTLSSAVDMAARLGLKASAIDTRIESVPLGDGDTTDPRRALQIGVAALGRRAPHEVCDLTEATARIAPDALLIDVNCWGGRSAAEAGDIPWACFSPYTPPLRSPGVPPFGMGLKPGRGLFGHARDAFVDAVVTRSIERMMLPSVNRVRVEVGLPPVTTADQYLRRAPLMLVATAKPFQYEQTDWGATVHMIGPCALDPCTDFAADWLTEIDRPIILVTTSSEPQADGRLLSTAVAALAEESVHLVATAPTGPPEDVATSPNVTMCGLIPHHPVLARAVCAVTHGGMGATQKALLHGVPVCVVPFGRDQFEVARRVEVARCGSWLPAKKLTSPRLLAKVRKARTMAEGAKRVAAGFAATGGTAHGAELFEQRILHDRR